MTSLDDWMSEARLAAAQCWCDADTSNIAMNSTLAESVATRIAAWMQTAAWHATNETYWRERAEDAEAKLAQAQEQLLRAVGHLKDMLKQDDGQAYQEAERFVASIEEKS